MNVQANATIVQVIFMITLVTKKSLVPKKIEVS